MILVPMHRTMPGTLEEHKTYKLNEWKHFKGNLTNRQILYYESKKDECLMNEIDKKDGFKGVVTSGCKNWERFHGESSRRS